MKEKIGFDGYARSRKYLAGCSGQCVSVFEYRTGEDGEPILTKEAARFTGLYFALHCLFSPDERLLAVRGDMGTAYIYSMESMQLVKEFNHVDGDKGEGYCFSHDGKKLYFIERVSGTGSMHARIISYDTEAFEKMTVEFENDRIELKDISRAEEDGVYYVLGYMRDSRGFASVHFTAKWNGNEIVGIRYVPDKEYFDMKYESERPGKLSSLFSEYDAHKGLYYDKVPPVRHCELNVLFNEIKFGASALMGTAMLSSFPSPYRSGSMPLISDKDPFIGRINEAIGKAHLLLSEYSISFPIEKVDPKNPTAHLSDIYSTCEKALDA